MALSVRQKLALNRSTAPINIWYGSVRSSKTYGQIWDMVARLAAPNSMEGVNLICGFSTNTVWRNIFMPILTRPEFKTIAPHLKYRQNAPTGSLFGVPFSVVGASNDSSWLAVQGLTVLNCWGDEAVAWPKSFWDMLLTRLSLEDSRLLVTCNPGSASHYLKAMIDRDGTDPDVHVEKFLLRQNPTLPEAYIRRLERQYTGVFHRRMILAEWVAAEGAIYESWDAPEMTVEPPFNGTIIAVGVDYGTVHKTRGYALMVTDTGELVISHEWAPEKRTNLGGRTRLTDQEQAEDFQHWLDQLPNRPKFVYCDPAAASFREAVKRLGIITHRADNAVLDGIRQVDSLLTNHQLKIATTCTELIDEIPSYRWDNSKAERGVDAPVKENDDAVDALRYTIRSSRHIWRRLLPEPTAHVKGQ